MRPQATQTATATVSPLAPYPYKLVIGSTAATTAMNFVEVFAFSNTGQNVAASLAGATVAASSVYSGTILGPSYGIDMIADPYLAGFGSNYWFFNSGSQPTTYNITFPVKLPLYPGGLPSPISTVFFVNRLDCCVSSTSLYVYCNDVDS